MGKLISKVMANCLAPRLNELVQQNQSVFIKGRLIQDSFKLVQSSAQLLHSKKRSNLMLKIDITRAFDSVVWPFLLQVLEFMGFPRRWLEWLSTLLSSASTCVMLNGKKGDRICHARSLCQGDPLSLMLSILAMEVLNGLFRKVVDWSLFRPFGV
jgi:hypothetical protein